jgi:predicted lactoylglutathione lyase
MIKEMWLNLPVKDLKRSREFFTKLGFHFDENYGNSDICAALRVGESKTVIMLFHESSFRNFAQIDITDTSKSSEVLISFDAGSPQEIDEIAEKAKAAGANVFGKPAEIQGWMYGCAFTDPDGHRWNGLYMDMSKMPR